MACQLWPPSVLGQPCDPLAELRCSTMSAVVRLAGLADRSDSQTFWNTVSLWPRYLPVLRSSFHRMPSLPAVKTQVLAAVVDEHALEDVVEIERFAGRVLEVPRQLAGIDVERERGVGVERVVVDRHAAAERHPGFGLRGAPVGEVQRRDRSCR